MLRIIPIVIVAAIAALVPGPAVAQEADGNNDGDAVIRINGNYRLPSGESVGTAILIHGDAAIDGTVRDALVVIDGAAIITGRVNGDITVISGDLRLAPGAVVNDVLLIRSDLIEEPGATIAGDVTRRSRLLFPGAAVVLGLLAWVGLTVMAILAGLLFAAVGGGQMSSAASSLTESPGQTILGAVVVVVGIPLAAVAAFVSLLGIVAGLGLLFFLLPALLFLGYLVAGAWLGGLITRQRREPGTPVHPYIEVAVGVALFQLALLIPGLGALAASLLAMWGAGGLAYLGWQAFRPGRAPTAGPPRDAPTTA